MSGISHIRKSWYQHSSLLLLLPRQHHPVPPLRTYFSGVMVKPMKREKMGEMALAVSWATSSEGHRTAKACPREERKKTYTWGEGRSWGEGRLGG